MKILFKIIYGWYKNLQNQSLLKLILIFSIVILFLILPAVSSLLPFTYLAL